MERAVAREHREGFRWTAKNVNEHSKAVFGVSRSFEQSQAALISSRHAAIEAQQASLHVGPTIAAAIARGHATYYQDRTLRVFAE